MRSGRGALGGLALGCVLFAPPGAEAQPAPRAVTYTPPGAPVEIGARVAPIRFGEALEFDWIVDIVPVRDGGLVVANSGTSSLHFIDRTGRVLRSVGSRGGGPGEYQDVGGVSVLPGDSIVVWDGILRRVTVLSPTGSFVRAFALAAPFEGGGSTTRVIALRSGQLIIGFSEVRTMAPSLSAKAFTERLVSYDSQGRRTDAVALSLLSSDRFVQTVPLERGGVAYWGLAFGRDLTVRTTAKGFATGDGTRWAVELRAMPRGEVREEHRLDRAPAAVAPADIEAFRARVLAGEKGADRVIAERMVAEMPFPKTQPAFVRFEVDENDRIWIEDYAERREERPLWIRLDPSTGRSVAVRFPARFTPRAFAGQMVYGIWKDPDDVQHVVGYTLRDVP